MSRRLIWTLAATVCAVALLLGGCGGSSNSGETTQVASEMTSTPSGGAGGDAVTIKDFAYAPPTLMVSRGSTIRFTNDDSTEHTATAAGGGFDTGSIGQGQTKSVKLDTSGTFSYVCTFHPFMHGTVTVR
jgi:plastocyanin